MPNSFWCILGGTDRASVQDSVTYPTAPRHLLYFFFQSPRSFKEHASSGSLSLHGTLDVWLQQEDSFIHLDLTGIQPGWKSESICPDWTFTSTSWVWPWRIACLSLRVMARKRENQEIVLPFTEHLFMPETVETAKDSKDIAFVLREVTVQRATRRKTSTFKGTGVKGPSMF